MKFRIHSLLVLLGSLCLLNTNSAAVAQIGRSSTLLNEQGVLEPSDDVLPSDDSLYDEYFIEVEGGSSLTITLESPDFDTYLFLMDSTDEVIDENDDFGSSTNSRLEVFLQNSGVYRVVVNGYDSTSRGEYTLIVSSTIVRGNTPSEEAMSSVEELREQARDSFNRGNYRRAIENYTQVINMSGDNECDFFYRGNANYKVGNYDRAVEDYNRSIRQNESNSDLAEPCIRYATHNLLPESYYNLGNAYFMTRRYEDASDAYTRAYQLHEGASQEQDFVQAKYNLAITRSIVGDDSGATSAFNDLFNLYNNVHHLCMRDGFNDEGVEEDCNDTPTFRQLDDLIPSDDGIMDIFLEPEPAWEGGGGPGRRAPSGANYNAARSLYRQGLAAARARNSRRARSLLQSSANAFSRLGLTQEAAEARRALSGLGR